ncbi:MAG: hypothetical protein ABF586_05330 [Sporolactobacillus sp.]
MKKKNRIVTDYILPVIILLIAALVSWLFIYLYIHYFWRFVSE